MTTRVVDLASQRMLSHAYICHGETATSITRPQGAFDLTNFEDGCLPAAFMAGLLVSAPIFVHFSAQVEPFKLVGIGLVLWFVSVFSCGLSWDFWSLLVCRTVVGVGEASFIILAAPFISTHPMRCRGRHFHGPATPDAAMFIHWSVVRVSCLKLVTGQRRGDHV